MRRRTTTASTASRVASAFAIAMLVATGSASTTKAQEVVAQLNLNSECWAIQNMFYMVAYELAWREVTGDRVSGDPRFADAVLIERWLRGRPDDDLDSALQGQLQLWQENCLDQYGPLAVGETDEEQLAWIIDQMKNEVEDDLNRRSEDLGPVAEDEAPASGPVAPSSGGGGGGGGMPPIGISEAPSPGPVAPSHGVPPPPPIIVD